MAPKSNLDWYRERVAIIEQEFGAKWLARKARATTTALSHPIPHLWARANAALASAARLGMMEMPPDLVEFFDLATNLEIARELPGYRQAITAQRLKSTEYDKDCYVADIAVLGVGTGYSVAFIPTSKVPGERTPDLSMARGDTNLQVECKRKDSYVQVSPLTPAWEALRDRIVCERSLESDYEVMICVVGELQGAHVDEIARFTDRVIQSNGEGEYSGGVPDCVLLIRKNPPRPVGIEGAWIPAWQNPAEVLITVRVDADGQPMYGPMLRATLYVINAHRLSQVLSSLNHARGQLDASGTGLIYIDVDTSLIHPGDHDLYFRTLGASLQRQFSPTANTRIAAVVLTGGIAEVGTTPNGGWHRTARYWTVVRNPHFPDSAELLIPGEDSRSDVVPPAI